MSPLDAIEAVKSRMDAVARELNAAISQSRGSSSYRVTEENKKVKITVQETNQVVMEADTLTVTAYKPLLDANFNVQIKAELILKALGIPPAGDDDKIDIQGGTEELRHAIDQKFLSYKEGTLQVSAYHSQ